MLSDMHAKSHVVWRSYKTMIHYDQLPIVLRDMFQDYVRQQGLQHGHLGASVRTITVSRAAARFRVPDPPVASSRGPASHTRRRQGGAATAPTVHLATADGCRAKAPVDLVA